MKRVAVLIESSNLCGGGIPGAARDVVLLHDFLISNIGGAWEEKEIITLHDPTVAQLEFVIDAISDAEYAFVSYSGHGSHSLDLDETKICVSTGYGKSDCVFPASKLRPSCPRSTISIDCCRNVEVEAIYESALSMLAMEGLRKEATNRIEYRKLFNAEVYAAETGCIRMYSCNIGESADESPSGGFFTRGLVETASWRMQRGEDVILDMHQAFNDAYQYVQKKNPTQHPQLYAGRRKRFFPWAVSPN